MVSITQKENGFIAIGIMPGVEIFIHIARVERGTVQLAIDCPRDFPVLRKDVYEAVGGFTPSDYERARQAANTKYATPNSGIASPPES